jgi:hypothetical protein
MKLFIPGCKKTVRQAFISIRVLKHWNGLPHDAVDAPSTNAFKNRLDKFWKDTEADMGIESIMFTSPSTTSNKTVTSKYVT